MALRAKRSSPILVAGDDDWEALGRMLERLEEFDVVAARTWPKLRDSVRRFEPDLVLMADTLRYPRHTAEALLERLYRDEGAKVAILSEFVLPGAAARWRERGAVDCFLHPTKILGRMSRLKSRIYEIVVLGKEGPAE